jgi:dolichyl-phosphate-mannose-protein mannosyltransferase
MGVGFKHIQKQHLAIALALLISFILRIYLSQFEGHALDIMHFKDWSRAVYYNGFPNFYSSVWVDYPPFYIYILWFVGAIYKLFFSYPFDIYTNVFTILIKSPANVMDIAAALLIFLIVKKHAGFKLAFPAMLFYAFNPAIIYNSAIWGQVDSINTFFILLALMFMESEKPELAGASMAIAILTKPQSLLLLPLIVILLVKSQKPLRVVKASMVSVAVFISLALPFYLKTSLFQLIKTYGTAYNEYSFTSVNAFNLWAFSGFWKPDSAPFLLLSYRIWGYILFGVLFAYVAYRTAKNRDNRSIYLASAVLFFGFFMLSTRIHERYLFPMFASLAIVMSMDRRFIVVFWVMTATFLFNLGYVLEFSHMNVLIPDGDPYVMLTSVINLGVLIYTLYCFSTSKEKVVKI